MFESGFDRFWTAYPASPRKGGKKLCQEKWAKYLCEHSVDQIIKHINWLKTTEQWLKLNGAFIPAPLVYLNQQRWDGAEVPEVVKTLHILEKLAEERVRAVPMPVEIKAKFDALRGRR